jgi:hypothetical protein
LDPRRTRCVSVAAAVFCHASSVHRSARCRRPQHPSPSIARFLAAPGTGAPRAFAEQISLLAGRAAPPEDVAEITFVALTHHAAIEALDTVLAYNTGTRLQVEVDIVLPPDMLLQDAHDIGESLQQRLEGLECVERAFVHLDTESLHTRDVEHVPAYDSASGRNGGGGGGAHAAGGFRPTES